MIGDRYSDIEFGIKIKLKLFLLKQEKGEKKLKKFIKTLKIDFLYVAL